MSDNVSANEILSMLLLKKNELCRADVAAFVERLLDIEQGINWSRYGIDMLYREQVIANAPVEGYTIDPMKGCEVLSCEQIPTCNFFGERPRFCEEHCVPGMVDVVTTRCKGVGCTAVVARTGFCAQCDTTRPRQTRVREHQVANFLRDHLGRSWTSWNKQLVNSRDCSDGGGYQPDFVYDCGSHVVVLEVDESQHAKKGMLYSCDNRRMVDCFNSCGGVPVTFVRFNPDSFKQNGELTEVAWEDRLTTLLELMSNLIDSPLQQLFTIFRLFYDTAITDCIVDFTEVTLERGVFEETAMDQSVLASLAEHSPKAVQERFSSKLTVSEHLYKRAWGIDKISEEFISENGRTLHASAHVDLCIKLLWPQLCLTERAGRAQSKQLKQLSIIKQVMEAMGWVSPFDEKQVDMGEFRARLLETDVFKHYAENIKLFNPRAVEQKDFSKSKDIMTTLKTTLGSCGIVVNSTLTTSGRGKTLKRFYNYFIDPIHASQMAALVNLKARGKACESNHAAEYLKSIHFGKWADLVNNSTLS